MSNYHDLAVKDIEFKIRPLTFRESLQFAKKKDSISFYQFVKEFLLVTTTLDEYKIDDMLLQDCISIMVFYKMLFWGNEEITKNLTPKSFLTQTPNYEEKIITFGGYRFTNLLKMSQVIQAEQIAYSRRDIELKNLYILASSCMKDLQSGIKVIVEDSEDNKEFREFITQLNDNISLVSHTKIDLLLDFENLSIGSENNQYILLENSFFFWD